MLHGLVFDRRAHMSTLVSRNEAWFCPSDPSWMKNQMVKRGGLPEPFCPVTQVVTTR
jgi:hypothetical protein